MAIDKTTARSIKDTNAGIMMITLRVKFDTNQNKMEKLLMLYNKRYVRYSTKGVVLMEIADEILKHPQYIKYMKLNAEAEKDRLFCKHGLQHAFDVARVAYIMSLEKNLKIKKEIIYATAILHDIAKWKQYRYGVDHASEGAILARKILEDIGIAANDIEEITEAISTHRKKDIQGSILGTVLYDSDKSCRPCLFCRSIDECNWFTDGKIPELKY